MPKVMPTNALLDLRKMALANSRLMHPSYPEAARCTRNYSDKSANGLQLAIRDFLKFSGCQCERISVMGRYVDQSKIVTDCLGTKRKIGTGKWINSSMQKGSADLSAIIYGRSIKIEIKMKDRQSEDQKAYQGQVENAGGLYWLVRSFDEFLVFYNGIV